MIALEARDCASGLFRRCILARMVSGVRVDDPTEGRGQIAESD